MVDPWMVWGKDEVWVDAISVLGPGCCGGLGGGYHDFGPWVQRATDEVWVHEIMALAHGCSEGRMRSGWTLYGLPLCPWMLVSKQKTTRFFTCLFPYSSPCRPL